MNTVFVIPLSVWRREIQPLAERAERAREASLRAGPAGTDDARTFASLLTEIETRVRRLASEGAGRATQLPELDVRAPLPWSEAIADQANRALGGLPGRQMMFVTPAGWGDTRALQTDETAPEGKAWRPTGQVSEHEATQQRWNTRLEAASRGGSEPLVPSGLDSRTLTMGLRKYVAAQDGREPVEAPVVYRDGSQAAPFPLHVVRMREDVPKGLNELRVALMSMRHSEMDVEVDACLLRNRDVSIARPAAETDDVATRRSYAQLVAIAAAGPRLVRVYQTGLEPANVGFYRALTRWLVAGGTRLVVVPMYFTKGGFEEGQPWSPR